MSKSYDLVVIGTGGGAFAAGIEARSRGKSVLLVEHKMLGGTCLNIGCVPARRCSPPLASGTEPSTTRSRRSPPARTPSTCPA